MSEREELARIIERAIRFRTATNGALKTADEILAAGYRKQRTIETVEELTALKPGSVVLDADHEVLSKIKDGYEEAWYSTTAIGGYEDQDISLPATLLWEPAD